MTNKTFRVVHGCFLVIMAASFMAMGYEVTGYNNATWAGGGGVVVNTNAYLPMTGSNCPKDTMMKFVANYADKIFNGCLDDCGDGNTMGHGLATVFDFATGVGGVGVLYSNLHHTGIWPQSPSPYPNTLVFWIKGSVGGEQARLSVKIELVGPARTVGFRMPIVVDTTWKRVVMPWNDFKVPAGVQPVGVTYLVTSTGGSPILFFIDQAYVSNRIPPSAIKDEFSPILPSSKPNQKSSMVVGTPGSILKNSATPVSVFDITGRQVNFKQKSGYRAYIINRNK